MDPLQEGRAVLAILDRINGLLGRDERLLISDCISEDLILFTHATSRDALLTHLVENLSIAGKLHETEPFHKAIMDREAIVSTGIGMGVAIPHAKLPGYKDFFIAVAINEVPLEWDALDGKPVHIVFMIGGPDNKQTEYLKILSQLTATIKDDTCREALFAATTPKQILDLFISK